MKYTIGVRSWTRLVPRMWHRESVDGRWVDASYLAALRVQEVIAGGGTVHPLVQEYASTTMERAGPVEWAYSERLVVQTRLAEAKLHCAYLKQELVRQLRTEGGRPVAKRWRAIHAEFFGGLYSPEIRELEEWVRRVERRAWNADALKGASHTLKAAAKAFREVAAILEKGYPSHRVLILGRDCEVLYLMLKDRLPEVRYAEISRLVIKDEASLTEIGRFLGEWAPDRPLLVVDTGFAGSIPKALRRLTPLEGRLMSSSCPEFPAIGNSSRNTVTSIESLWKSDYRARKVVAREAELVVVLREEAITDSGVVDPDMASIANRRILRLAMTEGRKPRRRGHSWSLFDLVEGGVPFYQCAECGVTKWSGMDMGLCPGHIDVTYETCDFCGKKFPKGTHTESNCSECW